MKAILFILCFPIIVLPCMAIGYLADYVFDIYVDVYEYIESKIRGNEWYKWIRDMKERDMKKKVQEEMERIWKKYEKD